MTTALATKHAVGYQQVSGTSQTGEHHSSLETQEARFHEYCARFDYVPVGTFIDVVSGRRNDRQEYRRMVEHVLKGGVDVIVVQFLDRFGRNPREILQRYWELQDHGGGILKKCVNSQAVYPLSEQHGLEAQERRYTAHEEGKH